MKRNRWAYLVGAIVFATVALLLAPAGVEAWVCDAATNAQVSAAPGGHSEPALAAEYEGGTFVAWSGTGESMVYAQLLDVGGNPQWGPNGVPVTDGVGRHTNAQVVASSFQSEVIIVWVWWVTDVESQIWAQRLNGSGERMWGPNGIQVAVPNGAQHVPLAIHDGGGGAFIVWEDELVGTRLYAQHLSVWGDRRAHPPKR